MSPLFSFRARFPWRKKKRKEEKTEVSREEEEEEKEENKKKEREREKGKIRTSPLRKKKASEATVVPSPVPILRRTSFARIYTVASLCGHVRVEKEGEGGSEKGGGVRKLASMHAEREHLGIYASLWTIKKAVRLAQRKENVDKTA